MDRDKFQNVDSAQRNLMLPAAVLGILVFGGMFIFGSYTLVKGRTMHASTPPAITTGQAK